jgi:hypothetical protein
VAFLRFTRDRRGYEHFYLVEPTTRGGKSSARLLYWFRSPSNVKVGREPFTEAVRAELESNNANVSFDWRKILDTPIPSAEAEKWRERRRAQRAERVTREAAVVGDDEIDSSNGSDDEPGERPVHVVEAAAAAMDDTANVPGEVAPGPVASDARPPRKKRRRRRGRRGRPGGPPGNSGGSNPADGGV